MNKTFKTMDKTKDFLQKNINLVYSIIVLVGVVFGWYDNYKNMQFEIQKYNEKFQKQEESIVKIQNQLTDYNIIVFKINLIEQNLSTINNKLDKALDKKK